MAAAAGGLSARKGGGAMSRDFGAESGTELLARLEGRTSLRELEPRLFAGEEGPAHGEILELHGPEGSGKTEMLYHLAARCLLPRAQGGLEAEALFVDADGHFDLLRLVAVLEWRLGQGPQLKGQEGQGQEGQGQEGLGQEGQETQGQEGPRRGQLLEGRGPGGSEAAVRTCLGRLRLLTCRSSTQLLLSLLALEARLCGAAPRLLLLDGLSAFYWLDRANGPGPAAQEAPLRACAQLLQRLARDHGLLLVATTQSLLPPRGAGDSDGAGDADGPRGARPYLCRAWQQAVGRSLLFSRPHGPAESFSILVRRPGGAPRRLAFRVGEGGLQFC
ncbi:DNA repair protein XRCC2 isoform X1 [Erinaceus europaeus]|uniref:DNA repair protein XRCC2 isoform X1 n=1 Tax=Erinaceus europaeus TaxID=9365 RepID=A0ABM3XVI1_ERIEU|nr:DNA repair protein XRCC2 isoform X1 [Erinaceus europaeus]